MAQIKVKGLIIKQSDFGEANRMLSVFTHEYGIISAAVYGAKSIKSGKNSSTQLLTYADFIMKKSQGAVFTIQSADVIERFFPIHEDIQKLSLCAYLCDLTYTLINTDSPDENILNLLLNCLYVLAYKDIDIMTVKAVFELRGSALAGYMPNLSCCALCSDSKNISAFSVRQGGLVCSNCRTQDAIPINSGVYHTLKYILSSDVKKIFSFTAPDDILKTVYEICEKYAVFYCEKDFESLNYFKKIQ